MKVSKVVEFDYSVDLIWNIVTNNNEYAWRKDVAKIEILDEHNFVETDLEGYKVTFTITKKDIHTLYQFDMSSKNIKGTWYGKFNSLDDNKTRVEFIEDVTTSNIIMKLFLRKYLNKQQDAYIKYLKQALIDKSK